MEGLGDYRIVGGHMVRLLMHVYPTERAVLRSTMDADTAVEDVEAIVPLINNLQSVGYVKEGGNVLFKDVGLSQRVEINLMLGRFDSRSGIRPRMVEGAGQVDSLPELHFAMQNAGIMIDVEVRLSDTESLEYVTRVPHVETAVILKAHSWGARRAERDLLDIYSLLEIREAYPTVGWALSGSGLRGFRKDAVVLLQRIGSGLVKKRPPWPVTDTIDALRFAALISKHAT